MRIGARYHADLVQLIPRSECEEWRELLGSAVSSVDAGLRWELLGPHRFGDAASTHLQLLVWHPDVASLEANKVHTAELLKALRLALQEGESCIDRSVSRISSTLFTALHLSAPTCRRA